MAIGTAAALAIGATAIGGAASSMSAGKAAGKAADTSLAAARENNALARDIYGQNKDTLTPFVNSGVNAGNYLNAFLGLPGAAPAAGGTAGGAGGGNWGGYLQSNPDVVQGYHQTADKNRFQTPEDYGEWHYGQYGQYEGRSAPTAPGGAPGAASGVTQGDAQNAFGNYLSNSDYGFQFATGANQVNSGYAGGGTVQSGAAMKALEGYRQNLQSGYRNQYMSALGNQQGVGLSAGSALAGVGQNYVNTISGNNNNAADAVGNAALVKGQNNPFASFLGSAGGALLGMGR